MSSDQSLDYNPRDLEMVREITPEGFREWIEQKIGALGKSARDILDRLPNPHVLLAPLLQAMAAGDSLWLCQSKKRGVLYGNEGIALVRDGQPVIYMRFVNY